MIITRIDCSRLLDIILEGKCKNELFYWVHIYNIAIPFDTCIYVIKQFVENPSLSSIELPKDKWMKH